MHNLKKKLDLCITCQTPIYEGEIVHIVDTNNSNQPVPNFVLNQKTPTEFIFQCNWCYQEWQKDQLVFIGGLSQIWNKIILCLLILANTAIAFFLVNWLSKKFLNYAFFKEAFTVKVMALLLIIVFPVLTLEIFIIKKLAPANKDRFKMRKKIT